jgi:uncharacterized DUF497 family protein
LQNAESTVEFEWDDDKREATIEKHGIDFQDAITMFAGVVLSIDLGDSHGEPRVMHVGMLEGREIVVVTTPRGGRLRVINARRARINERRAYHAYDAGRGAANQRPH